MGNSSTPIRVVLDTGSDWTIIPDILCGDCTGAKHNASVSGKQITFSTDLLYYGTGALEGMLYQDRTCISQTFCVGMFEYFGYQKQTNLIKDIEGAVGLCQNKQMMLAD
jgi:hypothetical protein